MVTVLLSRKLQILYKHRLREPNRRLHDFIHVRNIKLTNSKRMTKQVVGLRGCQKYSATQAAFADGTFYLQKNKWGHQLLQAFLSKQDIMPNSIRR